MEIMTIYYKDGFFDDTDGGFVPQGAKEITEKTHRTLLEGQSAGKQIISNKQGEPVLIESQPSSVHVLNLDTLQWEISPEKQTALLQDQRETIRAKINQLRDEKTAGGVYVASIGKWFDSDDKARANVIELKAAFDVLGDEVVPWTTYENDVVMMDHEKMKALFKELKDSKLHNHQTATQHKLALEQSTDPLNYDYSTGWSKTYADQEN
jgi:putative tail fiber assembly protein